MGFGYSLYMLMNVFEISVLLHLYFFLFVFIFGFCLHHLWLLWWIQWNTTSTIKQNTKTTTANKMHLYIYDNVTNANQIVVIHTEHNNQISFTFQIEIDTMRLHCVISVNQTESNQISLNETEAKLFLRMIPS